MTIRRDPLGGSGLDRGGPWLYIGMRRAGGAAGSGAGRVAAITTALMPGQAASAAPGDTCVNRANNTYQKLLECVTLEGVRAHPGGVPEDRRQQHRPGLPGHACCGHRRVRGQRRGGVADLLRDAGYEVTLDPVEITFNFPAVLRRLTPVAAEYETGVFTGSGSGTIEDGNVIPVDINVVGDRASTSGCGQPDFAGLDFSGDNDIALIQRGTCVRRQGRQRADRWRRGRRHLQSGEHA